MKNFAILFLLINWFSKILSKEQLDNLEPKKNKHFCGVDYLNFKIKKSSNSKIQNINLKTRNLKEEYTPIRIFVDTTYLDKQVSLFDNMTDNLPVIKYALNKSVEGINKLLEVVQFADNVYSDLNQELLNKYGIFEWDEQINNSEMLSLNYDYVLFPRFVVESDKIPEGVIAAAAPILLENQTKRPIAGFIMICNDSLFFEKENVEHYFSNVFIHELTHAFGFLRGTFEYFPGGEEKTIFSQTDKYGIMRYYIKTKKVVEFAKKYYGCNSIEGVEVENQGSPGSAGSHWEGRILLGEYMTSENYEDEVVISEFTLALLEDSGWYKTNYYTGGLLRFGKNKGCDFLTNYCLYPYNYNGYVYHLTSFGDEFFSLTNSWNPSCTTGRLSRAYNLLNTYNSFDDPIYSQLLPKDQNNLYSGGALYSADYCPVNYHIIPEYKYSYFVGSCKRGNGNYGTNIFYGKSPEEKQALHPNSELPEELGEKYSDNSFCMMSTLVPNDKKDSIYGTIFHPMCFPSYCSSLSLTVLIYDQYIVCPREGGNVEVNGYSGKLHCPDYNLICTGTVMCNDLFDCIEKKSESKYNTYNYDYYRMATQDYSIIPQVETFVSGELSEDGVCPKNCIQCTDNKKCKKCIDNYNLIGVKENDNQPIICNNTIDITKGYYLKDNIYYLCHINCETCSEGPISDTKMNCDKCKEGLIYNNKTKNCDIKEEEEDRNGKKEEQNDTPKNNNSFIAILITGIVIIVIIIILVVICIIIKKKRVSNDTEKINSISKEVEEMQLY